MMLWYPLATFGGLLIGLAVCWPYAYRAGYLAADEEYGCDQPCTAAHCAQHPPQAEPAPSWTDPSWRRQPYGVLERLDRAASTWAARPVDWLTSLEPGQSGGWPADPPPTIFDRMTWPTGEYATVEQTADRHLQPGIDWDRFLAELSTQTLHTLRGA